MKAVSLGEACRQMSPVLLEIAPGAEIHLSHPEHAGFALNFKRTTQFLYGEDIRDQVPTPSEDAWVRWVMHSRISTLMATRPNVNALIFPINHPDPQAEFYGYERQTIPCADGIDRPSSKFLIATVCWMATALVTLTTRQYISSKREAVQLYKTYINDGWTYLVEQVYEQCRNRWHYLIPDEESDRQTLRSLCQEALEFSNYFLSRYRSFVLHELYEEQPKNQLRAVKTLARIIYPSDREIVSVLKRLQQSESVELKQAADETENKIQQVLDEGYQ